jgi:hypothetical protein
MNEQADIHYKERCGERCGRGMGEETGDKMVRQKEIREI